MRVRRPGQESGATRAEGSPVPEPPLVVDLDGTLLRTDLLQECLLRLIKGRPWTLLLLPAWLLRGRAYLKRRIFELVRPDYTTLPVHGELVDWLRSEKAKGRRLVLATASDQKQAEQAVAHLDLFQDVLGSDGKRNLKGRRKLAAILHHCGPEFDYAGNSHADRDVWQSSRQAILVNAGRGVEAAARRSAQVTRVFARPRHRLLYMVRSIRLYQWVKNLLLFVPVFTSHTIFHGEIMARSAAAFLAFGLCASGVYVTNDLLDLEEDRRHSSKKNRPFASGQLSIPTGVLTAAACLSAGLTLAAVMGKELLLLLLLYVCLTTYYSLYLKRILLLDVLTLALLYTLRIIAGQAATGIPLTPWLLSFAFFLFLSLAFSKRAAELLKVGQSGDQSARGRGYTLADLQIVTIAGVCSGFLSSFVLALYINSDSVRLLYHRPAVLWGILPLLLYYITRVWVICGRGELDEDPILYTVKSPSTYYVAAMVVIVVIAATLN